MRTATEKPPLLHYYERVKSCFRRKNLEAERNIHWNDCKDWRAKRRKEELLERVDSRITHKVSDYKAGKQQARRSCGSTEKVVNVHCCHAVTVPPTQSQSFPPLLHPGLYLDTWTGFGFWTWTLKFLFDPCRSKLCTTSWWWQATKVNPYRKIFWKTTYTEQKTVTYVLSLCYMIFRLLELSKLEQRTT